MRHPSPCHCVRCHPSLYALEAARRAGLRSQHHGHGLTRETVSRELNNLERLGLAEGIDTARGRKRKPQ